MKQILLSILLIGAIESYYAQVELPIGESGKVSFTEVVTADGMSHDQLFNNGKNYFATTFKSPNTLKDEDKGTGTLTGQSFMGFDGIEGKVQYDISIMVKEGRYKFEFTNFTHQNYAKNKCSGAGLEKEEPRCAKGGKMSKSTWLEIKEKVKEETETLIAKLKKDMAQKGEKESGDDW